MSSDDNVDGDEFDNNLIVEETQLPSKILEARKRLWYMGELSWKLGPTQKKIYDEFHKNPERLIVLTCSRRLGKSYILTIFALEQCLKLSDCIVKFIQPEQKMIRINLRPIMNKILKDCPKDLCPKYDKLDNIYTFPNGSQIQLAGSDNGNAEKLRGGDTWLALVDEAGYCSDLKYLVSKVLLPTTTLTKGRLILSSTPPQNPDHDFNRYMDRAELKGSLIKKTIDDAVEDEIHDKNPRFTPEILADVLKEYPEGRESEEFKLEYLCQKMTNSSLAIIPEFTDVESDIVCEWIQPAFCDRYVSMDIGFKDLTVVIFGYYDFDNAVFVIEDEIVVNGPKMTTDYLADEIRKKETFLWTNKITGETATPYRRISDNNPILLNDLSRLHNIHFLPTLKDDKLAQINQLRMMIGNREIIINPRCKTVIAHLKKGVWKKDRKDFARSVDGGHADSTDACIYLIRNLDRNRNPYPKGYRHSLLGRQSDLFHNPYNKEQKVGKGFSKIEEQFKVKSSINRFKK